MARARARIAFPGVEIAEPVGNLNTVSTPGRG